MIVYERGILEKAQLSSEVHRIVKHMIDCMKGITARGQNNTFWGKQLICKLVNEMNKES